MRRAASLRCRLARVLKVRKHPLALVLRRPASIHRGWISQACVLKPYGTFSGTECAGINRHIVGDEKALVRRLNRRGVVNERVTQ
jgi:hypothetical protein